MTSRKYKRILSALGAVAFAMTSACAMDVMDEGELAEGEQEVGVSVQGMWIPDPPPPPPPIYEYAVYMDKPDPAVNTNHIPPSNYTLAVSKVMRRTTGEYDVYLNGAYMEPIAIAVAYGTNNVRCKVKSYFPAYFDSLGNPGNAIAKVYCHTPSGTAANSKFVFRGINTRPGQTGRFAHGRINADGTIFSRFNSTNGSFTVTKPDVGQYEISLANLGVVGGSVQIGALGGDNNHCKVASWGPDSVTPSTQKIRVRCYATNSTTPANTTFHVIYNENVSSAYGKGAYSYAHNSTSTSYNPSPSWTLISGPTMQEVSHVATGGLFSSADVGHYFMQYRTFSFADQSYVFVGAYGTATATLANYCKVELWGTTGCSGARCTVQTQTICFDEAGNRENTPYVQTWGPWSVYGPI